MAYSPLTIEFEFRNQRFQSAQRGLEYLARDLGEQYAKLGPIMKARMQWFLRGVAEALAQAHGTPWKEGTTEKTLSRRSGKAVRSIRNSVRVTGDKPENIEGRIGGIFYLRTHEFGATIKAKRATYLTIPTDYALNPDGTPIRPNARSWPNTFVAKSKKGNLIIFQRQPDKSIIPLYVLKKEVKIPARLGMGLRLKQNVAYFVDKVSDDMLKALRGDKVTVLA